MNCAKDHSPQTYQEVAQILAKSILFLVDQEISKCKESSQESSLNVPDVA